MISIEKCIINHMMNPWNVYTDETDSCAQNTLFVYTCYAILEISLIQEKLSLKIIIVEFL